jgi:hypothetical protein
MTKMTTRKLKNNQKEGGRRKMMILTKKILKIIKMIKIVKIKKIIKINWTKRLTIKMIPKKMMKKKKKMINQYIFIRSFFNIINIKLNFLLIYIILILRRKNKKSQALISHKV